MLQSMGWQRVGQDWEAEQQLYFMFTCVCECILNYLEVKKIAALHRVYFLDLAGLSKQSGMGTLCIVGKIMLQAVVWSQTGSEVFKGRENNLRTCNTLGFTISPQKINICLSQPVCLVWRYAYGKCWQCKQGWEVWNLSTLSLTVRC